MPKPDPRKADIEAASSALVDFLEAFHKGDYETALQHTQISWRSHPSQKNPKAALERTLQAIVPAGWKITNTFVFQGGAALGEHMVDISYRIDSASNDSTLRTEGVARVICESGYMKPDVDGTWGVNPVSMSRAGFTKGTSKPA
jgi:hypothetical protein